MQFKLPFLASWPLGSVLLPLKRKRFFSGSLPVSCSSPSLSTACREQARKPQTSVIIILAFVTAHVFYLVKFFISLYAFRLPSSVPSLHVTGLLCFWRGRSGSHELSPLCLPRNVLIYPSVLKDSFAT